MNKMMEQVQQMQAQMQQAQEDLKNETVQATAGGGMVTVTATGAGEIKEIVIAAAKFAEETPEPDASELFTDVLVESY